MIRTTLAGLLLGLLVLPGFADSAGAACGQGGGSTTVSSGVNGFLAQGEEAVAESQCAEDTGSDGSPHVIPARDSDLDALCVREAITSGRNPFRFCDLTPEQMGALTPQLVLEAFRRVALPESNVVIQPPGGETLVNFDTVFSTDADSFTRTVTLLGHRVELRIEATSFDWVNGDGTTQSTDWQGRKWTRGASVNSLITHRYDDAEKGLRPRVDTTWSATYRVDGGPWRDVPGTVTMTGAAYDLTVLSASPALAG